ncbi:MAG TPA: RidA family protein [Burkholderiaceae bacterium]|nr:RidA family protein [Burkholderiaceae bacterium]
MSTRKPRSLEIPGVTHGKVPIPSGARVGNLVISGGIMGKDPATDALPPDAASQARFAFQNLRTLLDLGGAKPEDVAKVTVYVKDIGLREHVNVEWLRMFPDPHDRPARHTIVHDLQNGMLLQLECIALIQED